MTQNVFISYSVKNQQIAFSICDMLESKGVSCWIMPRNEIAGVPYAMQIINGIKSADVTIFVCSAESNLSEHVHNEINIAFENNRTLVYASALVGTFEFFKRIITDRAVVFTDLN